MNRTTTSLAGGVLAVLTAIAASTSPLPPPPAAAAGAPRFIEEFQTSIRGENSSTLASVRSPSVIGVKDLVSAIEPYFTGGAQGRTLVRLTLNQKYPGLVTEDSETFYYTWVWCEEIGEYVRICCSTTHFRVSLADPVVVKTEIVTVLD